MCFPEARAQAKGSCPRHCFSFGVSEASLDSRIPPLQMNKQPNKPLMWNVRTSSTKPTDAASVSQNSKNNSAFLSSSFPVSKMEPIIFASSKHNYEKRLVRLQFVSADTFQTVKRHELSLGPSSSKTGKTTALLKTLDFSFKILSIKSEREKLKVSFFPPLKKESDLSIPWEISR